MKNIGFIRKYTDCRGIHYDVIYKNGREVSYYWEMQDFIAEFIRNSTDQIFQYNEQFNRHETLFLS